MIRLPEAHDAGCCAQVASETYVYTKGSRLGVIIRSAIANRICVDVSSAL